MGASLRPLSAGQDNHPLSPHCGPALTRSWYSEPPGGRGGPAAAHVFLVLRLLLRPPCVSFPGLLLQVTTNRVTTEMYSLMVPEARNSSQRGPQPWFSGGTPVPLSQIWAAAGSWCFWACGRNPSSLCRYLPTAFVGLSLCPLPVRTPVIGSRARSHHPDS